MGDRESETKKLLAKLEELEREEGEIEVLEQESRESNYEDREEGKINGEGGEIQEIKVLEQESRELNYEDREEGKINGKEGEIQGEDGEINGDDGTESKVGNSSSIKAAIGLYETDAGSREENVENGILGDERLKRVEDAEEAVATGDAHVQAFECFIGDENGASSDMEIEEDIPSPHLKGTHVSASFGEETISPLVVPEVDSQLHNAGNANNFVDSLLKRKRQPDLGTNPVIQVSYERLPRESKKRLQEALHQWSYWHSRRYPSGSATFRESLESGTDVYSPALYLEAVGNSSVSVWMDRPSKQGRKSETDEVNGAATRDKAEEEVPLYDRACVSALSSQDFTERSDGFLAIEPEESSRCFNCGGYTHSLLNCPRPRDANAISAARKMHLEKKGGPARSRAPLRYYHSSPGGKFDDIKPGALGNETRHVLGIGELDPPPWLHRMRELGYPPGYLEEAEDESSQMEIFGGIGDEIATDNGKEQTEDGEIVEKKATGDEHTVAKKMTVQFPGINAPIPENADKRLWTSPLEAQRVVKRSHQQQVTTGEVGETGAMKHSFSWFGKGSDPPRDDCTPRSNSSYSTEWARHGSSSVFGILNSPMDPSDGWDGWKRWDGETSTRTSSGRELQVSLPSPTGLPSELPPRNMFRAHGVGDILTTSPTPHIYSRRYHQQPPLLSLPIHNNSNEAWLKAQAALGVLQSDPKNGNSSSQQPWGKR